MSRPLSRRTFSSLLLAGFSASCARSFGIEPFRRAGEPKLRLSLAAYSFRDYFKDVSHPRDKKIPSEKQIDLFQFLDFCAAHHCAGAELTSYYFPPKLTPEFLLKIKRHAFLQGLELSGTAVGNSFTYTGDKQREQIAYVKRWIDHASLMGMPHVRVFAGDAEGQPYETAKRNCIQALEECCEYAGEKGVFLGLENHGGIVETSDQILSIVQAVESRWLGINLDTANFRTADPYADIEKCTPYAVNVQLKTELHPQGRGKERADLDRLIKILKEARYHGYVVLEYEADPDPYEAVPAVLEQLSQLFHS